jgi:regulator of sigma E protease
MLITSLVAFIVVIGVLIFVHELGHFMTAKWADIEVPRFSIGFGPKVLGFRRGETEYVISALPLGGYVKMAGMEEMEAVEGGPLTVDDLTGDEKTMEEMEVAGERQRRPRDFESKSLPVRALVISAGVIMNFLFAVLLYSVVAAAWGVPADPGPRLDRVRAEMLPEGAEPLAGVQPGARVTGVNGARIETWRDIQLALTRAGHGPATIDFQDAPSIQFTMPPADEQRGRLMNAVEPVLPMPAEIRDVTAGGPADQAGLQPGDRVVGAAGQEIARWQEFVRVVERHPGEPLPLVVERDGARIQLTVTPKELDRAGVVVGFIDIRGPDVPRVRPGAVGSLGQGLEDTWAMTRMTVDFVFGMVTGRHSARNIGGPIMIAQYSGRVARLGLQEFLVFMALLSVNLAVLNLLPIPVLDGGHLVFLAVEAVRGRALSFEQRMKATQVGFVFIMLLMAWAFGNDILRLVGL